MRSAPSPFDFPNGLSGWNTFNAPNALVNPIEVERCESDEEEEFE